MAKLYRGYEETLKKNNAMDFVGLTLPLTFDGVKITPWGMYGFVGSRSLGGDAKGDIDDMRAGMLPVLPSGSDLTTLEGNRSEGNAWWSASRVK